MAKTGLISIYVTSKGWMADFGATDAAGKIRGAMGCTELPLPFTATASAEAVRADVEKRNVGCGVVIGK